MQQRYVKVRGIRGRLLLDPRAPDADPRRYVGMRRKPDASDIRNQIDRYEPCDDVLLKSHLDASTWKNGDVELLGECIAENGDEATQALADAKPAEVKPALTFLPETTGAPMPGVGDERPAMRRPRFDDKKGGE